MRGSPEKPPRIITIVAHDDGNGHFDIHFREHVTRGLSWDEFLGSIAVITHPQLGKQSNPTPPYARLQHIDELLWSKVKWQELCPATDKNGIDDWQA